METSNGKTFEEAMKKIDELNKSIYVEGEYIVVNVEYEYNIPIRRCQSYSDILGWVYQLTEKTWMSRELLRHFIRVAHSASEIAIPQA